MVRSGCWFEGDSVAHGFELGDEATLVGGAVASFVEVVATEIGVGLSGREQVPADHQDAVADGDRGPAGSALTADPVVVGAQVRVLGSAGGLAGFDERDPEPFVTVAGASGSVFAGGLVVAGAHPSPRRVMRISA